MEHSHGCLDCYSDMRMFIRGKKVFPQGVRPRHKSSVKEWHAEGTVRLLYSSEAQGICPADHSLWIVINT